jgi:hypothetical protein
MDIALILEGWFCKVCLWLIGYDEIRESIQGEGSDCCQKTECAKECINEKKTLDFFKPNNHLFMKEEDCESQKCDSLPKEDLILNNAIFSTVSIPAERDKQKEKEGEREKERVTPKKIFYASDESDNASLRSVNTRYTSGTLDGRKRASYVPRQNSRNDEEDLQSLKVHLRKQKNDGPKIIPCLPDDDENCYLANNTKDVKRTIAQRLSNQSTDSISCL